MVVEMIRVAEMRSEADHRALLDALATLPGVQRALVNSAERIIRVERADTLSLSAILQALAFVGYHATVLV